MPDTHSTPTTLSTDPFLRRTAVTAALVAAVVLTVGIVGFLVLRPNPVDDFTVSARLVEPTDETRVTIDQIDCPGDRGSSPLAGTSFRDQVDEPNGKLFGANQAIAYVVLLEAGPDAVEGGRWDVELERGFSAPVGVACAFVVDDDVDTVERSPGAPAVAEWIPSSSGGDLSPDRIVGQLAVPDLGAGEQVVVQLIVALDQGDAEFHRLDFSMRPAAGTTSNSIERNDRADFSLPTDLLDQLTIEIDDEDGVDPGDTYDLSFTVTNPTPAVVSHVHLEFPLPRNVTLRGNIDVVDAGGHPTACAVDDEEVVRCEFGFLNPGEVVSADMTLRTRSTAIAFWSLANGPCSTDATEDICNRASVRWRASFADAEAFTTEATNLADGADLSVRLEAPTDVVYARRTVTLTISVSTDIDDEVNIGEVNVTGCIDAVYVDGDIDLDGLVDPGELWQYTCAARYDETGRTEAEVVGFANGRPIRGNNDIRFSVIDPLIQVERVEVEGEANVILRVTNLGDDPISRIAVTATQCNPRLTANDDGDEVLEPAEIWEYTCPAGASGGDVFGRDSLGAPLSAAVDDLT